MIEKDIFDIMKKEDYKLYNQFITAPASKGHHGAREGGLLEHSRAVVDFLKYWREKHPGTLLSNDDCLICGLLHDLCKADLYKKIAEGQYEYDKNIVTHHAKRSVDMIEKRLMIQLTTQQRCLILFHMTSWENDEDFRALTEEDLEWIGNPKHIQLIQAMNWADMRATEEDK